MRGATVLTIVAMQGSSFQPCPVCSQPIASALLAFHVNGCLEASGSGSKEAHSIAQQQQHPEQHAAGAAAAKAASAARPTSSLAQPSVEASEDRTGASTALQHPGHPQQGQQGHGTAAVQQHTRETSDADESAHRQPSRPLHASQQGQAQNVQASNCLHIVSVGGQPASRQGQAKPAEAQPKAAQHSVTPAGNAFSHMMSKQKERAQTWTFYLGREENGRLFWHIWRDVRGTAPIPEIITHCSGQSYCLAQPQTFASAHRWGSACISDL